MQLCGEGMPKKVREGGRGVREGVQPCVLELIYGWAVLHSFNMPSAFETRS